MADQAWTPIQFFHQADANLGPPQLCSRCGRVIVPFPRAPFRAGQLVLDTWNIAEAPPTFVDRKGIDSLEKPVNTLWCTEVDGIPDVVEVPPPLGPRQDS